MTSADARDSKKKEEEAELTSTSRRVGLEREEAWRDVLSRIELLFGRQTYERKREGRRARDA